MYSLDTTLLEKASIMHANITDKTVLLRSCLNVITDTEGRIVDDTRLLESLPCIDYLLHHAKKVIIIAHLGRPTGPSLETSFAHIVDAIASMKNEPVYFAKDLNETTINEIHNTQSRLVVVENIRYFAGEESKNTEEQNILIEKLAGLADIFVNDAFADYRSSVSTYEITKHMPSYVGTLFAKEVTKLCSVQNTEHPVVAVIGGSKLSEKIATVKSLLELADKVFVAGGIATTILKSQGYEIGTSLCEEDKLPLAKELFDMYPEKLLLPIDFVVHDRYANPDANQKVIVNADNIPQDHMVVDIGPETEKLLQQTIGSAKTIIANGTVGVYEFASCTATKTVLTAIADNIDAYSIVGGGNTIEAINMYSVDQSHIDHISTGGGAMLAILSQDTFPTLDVILQQYK